MSSDREAAPSKHVMHPARRIGSLAEPSFRDRVVDARERDVLDRWSSRKTPGQLDDYRADRNAQLEFNILRNEALPAAELVRAGKGDAEHQNGAST